MSEGSWDFNCISFIPTEFRRTLRVGAFGKLIGDSAGLSGSCCTASPGIPAAEPTPPVPKRERTPELCNLAHRSFISGAGATTMGGATIASGTAGCLAGTSTMAGVELREGGGAKRAAGREGGGCVGVEVRLGGGPVTPGLVPY